jgi:hypothetical protein
MFHSPLNRRAVNLSQLVNARIDRRRHRPACQRRRTKNQKEKHAGTREEGRPEDSAAGAHPSKYSHPYATFLRRLNQQLSLPPAGYDRTWSQRIAMKAKSRAAVLLPAMFIFAASAFEPKVKP